MQIPETLLSVTPFHILPGFPHAYLDPCSHPFIPYLSFRLLHLDLLLLRHDHQPNGLCIATLSLHLKGNDGRDCCIIE